MEAVTPTSLKLRGTKKLLPAYSEEQRSTLLRQFKSMKKVAIIRGKFLNAFDMQTFEKLGDEFQLTAFGSLTPMHDSFAIPVQKLPSPMDIPQFSYKMALLNRLFIDAQRLFGLENKLKGYDIAHTVETYYGYTQQAITAKEKGYVKKIVCTVCENIPFNNEGIWGRKQYKKRAMRSIDHFIAISKEAKSALIKEGVSPSRITVINHGIDTTRFVPIKQVRSEVKHLLFVGRLEKEKGVFELLSAFAKIGKKHRDITLTMIGNGSEKDALQTLAKEKGVDAQILWKIVPYHELPHEYQKADIVIAPSKATRYWQEQFGMVLAESLSCGVPVITTRSGSIPSTVGDAALLIPEGDSVALEQAITFLIRTKSLREALAQKGRKRAVAVFDAHKVAEKIRRVYNMVAIESICMRS